MRLTIDIPPETEIRLRREASRLGINERELVKHLIDLGLPPRAPDVDQRTLDLLAQWDREDETNDPAEISQRIQEFEELKAALNNNRLQAGGPHARKVFQ